MKYRARQCPKCNYFVGFAIAKQLVRARQVSVTNFCLNCNYKLPVHTIVRGVRKSTRSSWRPTLRLVRSGPQVSPIGLATQPRMNQMDTKISPADYARHLRAIGQDLENLHLSTFNLEYTGDAYLVWIKSDDQSESNNPLFRISKNRLQKLWRSKIPARVVGHEESFALSSTQTGKRLRYSVQELDRIEREHRSRRRQQSGTADGH
jgi:hypothetical protein